MRVVTVRLIFSLNERLFLCLLMACSALAQTPLRGEALQFEMQGKLSEAETAWHSILKADRENPEALAHLGLIAARQDRYSQAITFYKRALAAGPKVPGLQTNLGLAYFKNSQFAEAIQPFTEELIRQPGDQRLLLLLGMTHYGLGDYLVAIPYLKRSAALQATNLPLRLALAHSCLWSKQFDCVMATYREILLLDSGSAEAEMIAGEALDETGDDTGALQHFRAAASANSSEPNVHFAVGYLLWTLNRFEEAAEQFIAEIAKDGQQPEARVYLGDCYLQLDKLPEAESALHDALKLDPLSQIAHRDLGVIEAKMGRPLGAEAELRHAIDLDPSDATARYRYARILQSLGKREEAEVEFKMVGTMKQEHRRELLQMMDRGAPQAPAAP